MRLRTSEKRGILLLVWLTVLFFVFPSSLPCRRAPLFVATGQPVTDTTASVPPIRKENRSPGDRENSARPQPAPIELNAADSAQLVVLKGIGPYYARKILRYRDQLGGFYRVEQLREIRFEHLEIDPLLSRFRVDTTLIRKQRLDTMAFRSVLRHPYLEYEHVVLIFEAKRKWGGIQFHLLEEKGVLPQHILRKIKPYFE